MSADWDELRRIARALPPRAAEAIGDAWARDAQLEHASIASFGRFALELLVVAAPSELVVGAHRAAIEEVEHARLCFSLASVYRGTPLGPGPLPLDPGALTAPSVVSMTYATVLEGCVNETLAALEAEAAAALAEPAAVREALRAIERQESSHASLAFQFVGWAVTQGGAEARDAARSAFALASEHVLRAAPATDAPDPELEALMSRHGRLPSRARAELRRRALAEVIEPAARELLA